MKLIRDRLTYANVMSTLGVFIALGLGSAYAADKIGPRDIAKKAVRSKHLKNKGVEAIDLAKRAVKSTKLAPDAVHTRKVLDGSLLGVDFAPGELPRGEQGPAGPRGEQGPQGPQGDPATRLFAVVTSSGFLVTGEGATDAQRNSSGTYEVMFDRPLENCAAIATAGLGLPSGGGTYQVGSTATVKIFPAPPRVLVETVANGGGATTDRNFHLAVFC